MLVRHVARRVLRLPRGVLQRRSVLGPIVPTPLLSTKQRVFSVAILPDMIEAHAELQHEIGRLTSEYETCEKEMESAKFTARLNPLSSKGRDKAEKAQHRMERVHDQFQMLLQREGHKNVTRAEIVLNAYKSMFEARAWHYNIIMDSYRRHSPGQCWGMLRRMDGDGIEPDVDFFNIWLNSLSKERAAPTELQRIVGEMVRRGIDPDRLSLSSVLESLAISGDLEQVDSMLERMVSNGMAPTPGALVKVMVLYGKLGLVSKGDAIRDSLLAATEATYSLSVYSAIMRYSIRRRHRLIVESLWDDMDVLCMRPSPNVFDAYVTAVFSEAFQLNGSVERKKALDRVLGRASRGAVRLTLSSILPHLPALIDEYATRPDILAMFFAAVTQSNFDAKDAVQAALASWFHRHGDFAQLQVVLDTIDSAGGMSLQSLAHSIIKMSVLSNPSACHKLVRYLVGKGIPVYRESLSSIIFSGACRADLDGCDTISALMKDLGMLPTEASLNAHLNAAIQSNAVARVNELFEEARQLGYALSMENAQYLLIAASGRADIDTCAFLFEVLKQGGTRTPTSLEFDSMIAVKVKSSDPYGALGLLREMRLAGHAPSYSLIDEVVNALVERRLFDDALHLVEAMSSRDPLISYITTCSNLIKTLAEAGELERCEEVCIILERAGGFPRPNAVCSLIVAFGNVGMVDMAEQLLGLLVQRQTPAPAIHHGYNSMLAVLARNAMFNECGKMISDLTTRGIPIAFFAFRALVSSFAFRGRLDECEATFAHFSAAQPQVNMATVFAWLTTPYARAGQLNRLREFARISAKSPTQADMFIRSISEVAASLASKKLTPKSMKRLPQL